MRRSLVMLIVSLAVALIVVFPGDDAQVAAKDTGPAAPTARGVAATAGNPARVIPSMSVTRQGGEATYSITLRNSSDTDVRDIFLAGGIPPGASFIAPGPNPARSGFRAVEDNNAVWLSEVVPARSELGPFSYRVTLGGDTADPVHAWTHWRSPSDATNLSADVRVLPSVTTANLASGTVERLPGGPLIWTVNEVVRPAQFNQPGRTVPTPRLIYMLEGSTRTFAQGGVTGTYGPGSAHFIRPNAPFDDAVRADSPVRHLVFAASGAGARGLPPPGPNISTLLESEELTGIIDGPYTFTLSLVEAQPGGSTPTHYHTGPTVVHVLAGTVVHNLETGSAVYGVGSFWIEQRRELNSQVYLAPTKLLVARLVPEGHPPTIFSTEARPHPWTRR